MNTGTRHKMAQPTGPRLARDRKRTEQLANILPRGVKIGVWADARPKPYFVRFGHPRKTESYATEEERNQRATELAEIRENSGAEVMRFQPALWAEFMAWREERDARPMAMAVSEAIAQYLAMRGTEGLAADSYRHTKTNLSRFGAMFGAVPLDKITPPLIRSWLADLKDKRGFEPVTVRHHRKDLNVFLNRAVREGWLKDNPCKAVLPPTVTESDEVSVMSLRDAFTFFKVNQGERCIGRLALEAFAGMRYSGAGRLQATDLDFAESGITMPASQHKSGRRHYVDGYPRNLWKWLAHAPAQCWGLKPRNYGQHKAFAFARSGVVNPGNVFRHTFATMHLAAFKDAPALGVLLTHRNLTMLYQHYRGRGVPQATALAYFKITPVTVRLSFERFCQLAGANPQTT